MGSLVHSAAFRFITFLVLSTLAWPVIVLSQDNTEDSSPGLTAFLDRDSARIGSMVVLTLGYRIPEGASLPAHLEIRGLENITRIDHEIGPDQIKIRLLVDQMGSWKTGPLSLTYLDKEGRPQTLTADPVSLTVLSNLGERPNEAHLRPIQGIIQTKPSWLKRLPWIAGLLGILLMGLGLVWWYRRRRGKETSLTLRDPPHIRAKKEIEELEAQRIFEKGDAKGFYFRFSEILRHYLEALRGFPAAEFTTQEIALCIDKDQDRKLLPLLRHADLVKFADTLPTQAKKEDEVKAAFSYIQETSPTQETGQGTGGSQGGAP
jgi:hypothetical protein